MPDALQEMPDSIELTRAEYRAQHAALEVALDILDRFPDTDPDATARSQLDAALRILLRRIWPFLDELNDEG